MFVVNLILVYQETDSLSRLGWIVEGEGEGGAIFPALARIRIVGWLKSLSVSLIWKFFLCLFHWKVAHSFSRPLKGIPRHVDMALVGGIYSQQQ